MKKQALIAANISNEFKSYLLAQNYELTKLAERLENVQEITGIVTSTKLHLDKATIDQYPNLKWIARLGSGIEIIDLDYCKTKNIAVASSPAGIANAVAEHCVAMLISLQKNIHTSYSEIKNQHWIREPNRGWELEGKTIGIIGYGHTGKAFAKKLSVFGVRTLAYDKYKSDFGNEYATEVTLIKLQQQADIISFHVPLNAETKYYYNQSFIAQCQQHILLNTSRGGVVNTQALLDGLDSNAVLTAALDVLDNEHLLLSNDKDQWSLVDQLLAFNVMLTPHIAGYSYNAIEKMCNELLSKLKHII